MLTKRRQLMNMDDGEAELEDPVFPIFSEIRTSTRSEEDPDSEAGPSEQETNETEAEVFTFDESDAQNDPSLTEKLNAADTVTKAVEETPLPDNEEDGDANESEGKAEAKEKSVSNTGSADAKEEKGGAEGAQPRMTTSAATSSPDEDKTEPAEEVRARSMPEKTQEPNAKSHETA
jgi:CPA1 family monovalent cation:H+ antiporter